MSRPVAVLKCREIADRGYAMLVALPLILAILCGSANAADVQKTPPTVALLNPAPPVARWRDLVRNTLVELGYEPGRNIIYLERWASGSQDQLNRDAIELAQLKVDVVVVGSSVGVRAAARATKDRRP